MPSLPWEAMDLYRRRDETRRRDPHDPEVNCLHAEAEKIVKHFQTKTCHDELVKTKDTVGRLWNLSKKLQGKQRQPLPNQPIRFGWKTLTRHHSIANYFGRQYTALKPHSSNPKTRKIIFMKNFILTTLSPLFLLWTLLMLPGEQNPRPPSDLTD